MDKNIEKQANRVGNFLVRGFHYLALFAIGSAIVWSAFFTFLDLLEKTSASIEDILLLFIYLELGAIVGIYFKTDHIFSKVARESWNSGKIFDVQLKGFPFVNPQSVPIPKM